MKRIYLGSGALIVANKVDARVKELMADPSIAVLDTLNRENLSELILAIEGGKAPLGLILENEFAAVVEAFDHYFTRIVAAGGFVFTPNKDVLLIFRKGKWDLPKGKLDEGESLEACAVREVEEETGANELALMDLLHTTYHIYKENGRYILKESFWYLMKAPKASVLVPQLAEDIQQSIWVPARQLVKYSGDAHASIVEVFEKGIEFLSSNH